MIIEGPAMFGIGMQGSWKIEVKSNYPYKGTSSIDNKKFPCREYKYVDVTIPFQTGQENEIMNFIIKLEQFINKNYPSLEVTKFKIKQCGN